MGAVRKNLKEKNMKYEEKKVQMAPVSTKPQPTYEERISRMSDKQLAQEALRLARKPASKLAGALADILLITVFKTHDKGNDPYMLDYNSVTTKAFEIR